MQDFKDFKEYCCNVGDKPYKADVLIDYVRRFEDGELEVVPHINPTTGKINKFAEQWRIFFPQPSQNTLGNLTLPGDIDIKTTIQNKMLSVNNSNYVKNLIAQHAFRVGRNDGRIDYIRDTIPLQFRKVFDDGVDAK